MSRAHEILDPVHRYHPKPVARKRRKGESGRLINDAVDALIALACVVHVGAQDGGGDDDDDARPHPFLGQRDLLPLALLRYFCCTQLVSLLPLIADEPCWMGVGVGVADFSR